MKPRSNRRIGNEEIALAMELRTEGVRWKIIAYGLGVAKSTIVSAVAKAKREGMK